MANSFTLSNDAERDIIDIYLYSLEQFGETQADAYIDALYQRFAQIAAAPTLGRDFGDIHDGVWRLNQQSHAIYYKQDTQGLFVLRVLHQSMDPARHLGVELG